ncbi:GLUG motif-containing protein [Eubacteriaceae bacterium ES2]|nr:GLUG motif-containing protein [Eubacteriaceae bacterium ES2]
MKFKKLILFTGLLLGLFMLSGTTVMAEGTTSTDPFKIDSVDKFNAFATAINAYSSNDYFTIGSGDDAVTYTDAELTDNINLGETTLLPHRFAGIFEGNNFTITYSIKADTNGDPTSLLGNLNGATIRNLKVDATIECSTESADSIGGITSFAENNSLIENCSVNAEITIPSSVVYCDYVGGISGPVRDSNIRNCSVVADIHNNASSTIYNQRTAGIAGGLVGKCLIENCSVAGSISGYRLVGGITGETVLLWDADDYTIYNSPIIRNCSVFADVSGTKDVGIIVGHVSSYGTISNVYYLSDDTNNKDIPAIGGIDVEDRVTHINLNKTSKETFNSGQVAWGLQKGQDSASGLVWGQSSLDTSDSLPLLTTDADKQVYQLTINKNDGNSDISYHNAGYSFNLDTATTGCIWLDGNDQVVSGTSFTLSSDMTFNEAIQAPTLTASQSVINETASASISVQAPSGFTGAIKSYRSQINGTDASGWSDSCDFTDLTNLVMSASLQPGLNTIYVQVKTADSPWSQTASLEIYCLGVENNTIQIASPADFIAFATYINNDWDTSISDAILTSDLNFDDPDGDSSTSDAITLTPVGSYAGNLDITYDETKSHAFTGNFSGNGHSLTVSQTETSATQQFGVFGCLDGAEIKDLTINGCVSGANYTGGIAGYARSSSISNCTLNADVSSTGGYVGGIAGATDATTISGCSVHGSLTGLGMVGGIAGDLYNSTVENCTVTDSVTFTDASADYVGGITGTAFYGTIKNCNVFAAITGHNTVGGITGQIKSYGTGDNTVENCCVTGNITGASDVGGIAGYSETATIKNAFVSGDVTAPTVSRGGIVGNLYSHTDVAVSNVYYNSSLMAVSNGNFSDGSTPIPVFSSASEPINWTNGSVAWGLQDGQPSGSDLVWGQLLGTDATPVLITDPTTEANKQVHQLLFFNNAADITDYSAVAYTCFANNGGTTVDLADPGTGYNWMNGSTQFTAASLVTDDLSLVKTSLPAISGISVSTSITTTVGSTPSFDDYGFTGTFPTGYAITYSTDNTNFSTTLPTFSTAGTYTVYFKITATGYLDNTDLSTTVTVNNPVSPGGGGGGSVTPTMTGITVPTVTTTPDGTLNFDITGLPAGAIVYYSTDGITYTTTPPSFSSEGDHTVYIKITATGYQDFTTTTTVTVEAGDDNNDDSGDGSDGGPIILDPLTGNTGTQPSTLSGGGYGFAYSYDLAAYLSGSTAPSAASNTDSAIDSADYSLSVASATAYSIASIDDPYGLLADSDNAPAISDSGIFSCYLNYAAGSPIAQTTAEASRDTETAAASSTESADNLDSENASTVTTSDTADADPSAITSDNDTADSDIVMLTATVVINVTLESGDITPVTLDIEVPQQIYTIDYRTHIQNIGWEDEFVENGTMSGTQGQGLRLEAIEIQMNSDYDLGVSYRTHVENIGWEENYVSDGQESGTDGQGLRLEAIELSLTGADADYFDIYYQVHVQNLGWLDWASNGHPAGSAGFGYRLEGIRIVVVPKGGDAPGATANCFVEQ